MNETYPGTSGSTQGDRNETVGSPPGRRRRQPDDRGNQRGGRGRPPTPVTVVDQRRARWRQAVSFSGLKQVEIADLVGRSLSRIAAYGARHGAVPPEDVIMVLEAYCRDRVEREAERLRAA